MLLAILVLIARSKGTAHTPTNPSFRLIINIANLITTISHISRLLDHISQSVQRPPSRPFRLTTNAPRSVNIPADPTISYSWRRHNCLSTAHPHLTAVRAHLACLPPLRCIVTHSHRRRPHNLILHRPYKGFCLFPRVFFSFFASSSVSAA